MEVLYIYILIVLIPVTFFLVFEKNKIRRIKQNGVRTVGVIVYSEESNSNSMFRLGGNINNPVIKFVTEDGRAIIGKPISGFISQHEVFVMDKITIIYDKKNPDKFCVVEV